MDLAESSSLSSSSSSPWYTNIRRHLASNPPSYNWSTSNEDSLLEPYTYLASRPGKEIRGKLIDAFNHWLQVPDSRLARVRKVVDMLHTASLLMDDVEDNSDLRRGLPVAHKVYGTPQVLNSANYVYFLVFREIEAMGNEPPSGRASPTSASAQGNDVAEPSNRPSSSSSSISGSTEPPNSSTRKATLSERLLVEEMINLHRGQGLDLLWRDTLQCPTEEEYVEMVRNKTGGLLRIAGGLMMIWSPVYPESTHLPTSPQGREQLHSQQPPDLLPLLDLIGLLFQIRDDYMNLSAESYAQNKGFAEDLTEGKFSFPMIHGIRASGSLGRTEKPAAPRPGGTASPSPLLPASTLPPNRQLMSILSSKPTDPNIKQYAIDYLESIGSFAHCRRVMRELDTVIWKELEVVETSFGLRNDPLRKILEALRGGWSEAGA